MPLYHIQKQKRLKKKKAIIFLHLEKILVIRGTVCNHYYLEQILDLYTKLTGSHELPQCIISLLFPACLL